MFLDAVVFLTAFYLSYRIRFQLNLSDLSFGVYVFIVPILAVWIYVLKDLDLYKHRVYISRGDQAIRILKASLILFLMILVFELFFRVSVFRQSRLIIIYFIVLLTGLSLVVRVAFFKILFSCFNKTRIVLKRAIIVGTGDNAETISARIIADKMTPIEIVGFVKIQAGQSKTQIFSRPVLGHINELLSIITMNHVDKLILAVDLLENNKFFEIYDICKKSKLPVYICHEPFRNVSDRLQMHEYNSVEGFKFDNYTHGGIDFLIKRIADLSISILLLFLVFPLFVIVSILIKITSRGPFFFKQKRIGKDSRPFYFYKLRSMRVDNDESIHREYIKKLVLEGHPAHIEDGKKDPLKSKMIQESHGLDVFSENRVWMNCPS